MRLIDFEKHGQVINAILGVFQVVILPGRFRLENYMNLWNGYRYLIVVVSCDECGHSLIRV